MWNHYTATITVDRLVAGIPAHEKPLGAWLDAKAAKMAPQPALVAAGLGDVPATPSEASEDLGTMLSGEEIAERHTVVFYRVDGKPALESRCIKSAFKEAANILKDQLSIKNARARLAERVFVIPRFLPIEAEVQSSERPISVMTRQGPRTSLKSYEYVENVTFTFEIKVLDDGSFTEKHLRTILEYLQDGGIGSDRSQGAGTFTLVTFEPAHDN